MCSSQQLVRYKLVSTQRVEGFAFASRRVLSLLWPSPIRISATDTKRPASIRLLTSRAWSFCEQFDHSAQCLRSTFVISERIDAECDASNGHRMIDHELASAFTHLLDICTDFVFVVTLHCPSIRSVSVTSPAAWSFHEYQEPTRCGLRL